MIEENDTHLLHYLVLLLGLFIFFLVFVYFRFNVSAQLIVTVVGCIFYSLWGIIHHALEGRLTRLIALEYVLFSCLVFLLIFTTLSL